MIDIPALIAQLKVKTKECEGLRTALELAEPLLDYESTTNHTVGEWNRALEAAKQALSRPDHIVDLNKKVDIEAIKALKGSE